MFVVVCNAGYYMSRSDCLMCTENKIKMTAGNETNCDADNACAGVTVANQNHTACGMPYFQRYSMANSSSYIDLLTKHQSLTFLFEKLRAIELSIFSKCLVVYFRMQCWFLWKRKQHLQPLFWQHNQTVSG